MHARPTVSLIATVKNEREHLEQWLEAIASQTRQPDEIVIVDGGSSDGTWERLTAWRQLPNVKLYRVAGASISVGRNVAMSRASGEIFAVTDCGTVAKADWLERLTSPFGDPLVDVVSGFFVPDASTTWERALAAATLPDTDDIQPASFLPSSRSVAVRAPWVLRGFEYPEWLDYCEDIVWDLQLNEAGARFQFAPDAKVRFFVRPDAIRFWHQYCRYARGDGKAGLFGLRHAIRYATYAAAILVLARRRKLEAVITLILACGYIQTPVRRLLRRDASAQMPWTSTVQAAVLIPAVKLIGDVAKMAGYPVGLAWRLRRFGTINPMKNWRRITPEGELWKPGSPHAGTRPPVD